MTQNREPPAYQEYPAQMLAKQEFRLMSLEERGLLLTMRLECWVNKRLPADPENLAKLLGLESAQVIRAIRSLVPSFLAQKEGYLLCPELDDYRQHLADRREKQSKGGAKGASITNGSRKAKEQHPIDADSGTPSAYPQAPRQAHVGSLVQNRQVKQSKDELTLEDDDIDPWLADYDQADPL